MTNLFALFYSAQSSTVSRPGNIQLLAEYDIFVDREKLRMLLHSANTKGPLHLLGHLVAMVFSEEDLASSCA